MHQNLITQPTAMDRLLSAPIAVAPALKLDRADQIFTVFSPFTSCPAIGQIEWSEGGLGTEQVEAQRAEGCPLCEAMIVGILETVVRVRASHGLAGVNDFECFEAEGVEHFSDRDRRRAAERATQPQPRPALEHLQRWSGGRAFELIAVPLGTCQGLETFDPAEIEKHIEACPYCASLAEEIAGALNLSRANHRERAGHA